MGKAGRAVTIVALGVIAAGCAATPEQRQAVQQARLEAMELLDGFAAAIQEKAPDALRPLLAPRTGQSRFVELGLRMRNASWLEFYSGYTLDVRHAVENVRSARWLDGEAELTVAGSNAQGERFEDQFVLSRGQGGWYIKDFTLRQPEPGDPLDPPPQVAEQIRPQVVQIMTWLKEGRIGEIYYAMPEEPQFRYRMPKLSFWQKLSAGDVGPISVFTDLQRFRRLTIAAWPDLSQPLELEWLAPGAMNAVYELPYAWQSPELETLTVRLTFVEKAGAWTFHQISLVGAAMPYSEEP